jgi:DNA primase
VRPRYTPDELYHLRNDIPIGRLITNLDVPTKVADGDFRFRCPQCHEFNTAINPETNLARCFGCKENFNPIDMVMIVEGLPFRDAVEFLSQRRL